MLKSIAIVIFLFWVQIPVACAATNTIELQLRCEISTLPSRTLSLAGGGDKANLSGTNFDGNYISEEGTVTVSNDTAYPIGIEFPQLSFNARMAMNKTLEIGIDNEPWRYGGECLAFYKDAESDQLYYTYNGTGDDVYTGAIYKVGLAGRMILVEESPIRKNATAEYFYPTTKNIANVVADCKEFVAEENDFINCFVSKGFTEGIATVYDCYKSSDGEPVSFMSCQLGKNLGETDLGELTDLVECYQSKSEDHQVFSSCFADLDQDSVAARIGNCVEQQLDENVDVTFWGTAQCYAANELDITPEQQIAIDCAMKADSPADFVGCTAGTLTRRELRKCIEEGIGGDNGCFGKNNELTAVFDNAASLLEQSLGENNEVSKQIRGIHDIMLNGSNAGNDLVKGYNNSLSDLKNGPGENNEVVKAVNALTPSFPKFP